MQGLVSKHHHHLIVEQIEHRPNQSMDESQLAVPRQDWPSANGTLSRERGPTEAKALHVVRSAPPGLTQRADILFCRRSLDAAPGIKTSSFEDATTVYGRKPQPPMERYPSQYDWLRISRYRYTLVLSQKSSSSKHYKCHQYLQNSSLHVLLLLREAFSSFPSPLS